MKLDLSSLQLALHSLQEAIAYSKSSTSIIAEDIIRDSIIQRFEYSYELCWKFMQRWIKLNVSPEDAEPRTKKDLFRLAAKKQLINQPEDWFNFAEARNQVAHTYNQQNAQAVYEVALAFLPAALAFFAELEKVND